MTFAAVSGIDLHMYVINCDRLQLATVVMEITTDNFRNGNGIDPVNVRKSVIVTYTSSTWEAPTPRIRRGMRRSVQEKTSMKHRDELDTLNIHVTGQLLPFID